MFKVQLKTVLTSVQSLYNSIPRYTSNFYYHDDMVINDIWTNDDNQYVILYANGHMKTVDGSDKVKVLKT